MATFLNLKQRIFNVGFFSLFLILTISTSPFDARAETFFKDNFENGISGRWEDEGFLFIKNKTVYELYEEENGNKCIRATSDNSFSGKGIFIGYDPKRYPILEWRWKIENIIERGDARNREGDDYAAKIYVIFGGKSYINPLDKRILVYFWANKLLKGEIISNAYEPRIEKMIALQSGSKNVGIWKSERVNIYEDYKKAFGEEPENVEGISFVTDTDNTKERAVSYYDDIVVKTR